MEQSQHHRKNMTDNKYMSRCSKSLCMEKLKSKTIFGKDVEQLEISDAAGRDVKTRRNS